jgi:hypothetical protein
MEKSHSSKLFITTWTTKIMSTIYKTGIFFALSIGMSTVSRVRIPDIESWDYCSCKQFTSTARRVFRVTGVIHSVVQ